MLLGNPIPRWNLIVGSAFMVATYLLVLVAVIGTVLWIMASVLDLDLNARQAYRAAIALWPLAIAFGALALAISSITRQRSIAIAAPAATVFLMFLANVISKLAPDISGLRYISAYHYYGNAIIEGLWWPGAIVLLATALLLTAVAVVMFNRRDIYA